MQDEKVLEIDCSTKSIHLTLLSAILKKSYDSKLYVLCFSTTTEKGGKNDRDLSSFLPDPDPFDFVTLESRPLSLRFLTLLRFCSYYKYK